MGPVVDVFLSYRHSEPTLTWVRDVLAPAIRAEFSLILDADDFLPGQIILEEMETSSARARLTVAVVDETYEDSWYTRYEAALAETLLVVQRGAGIAAPLWDNSMVVDGDDPAPVIEEIHRLVKRVFILESEADRQFATGFLIPALRAESIDARDVAEVALAKSATTPAFESLDHAIRWADHVIVVVSRAYVHDLGHTKGRLLQQFQARQRTDLTIPVLLDRPSGPDDDYQIPPQYRQGLRVDLTSSELWYEALQTICRAIEVEPPRPSRPPPCPYPGMRPYGDDGRFPFVGHEREIASVVDRLRRSRRTAVVIGPSGSGKSSLVLAGVLPHIRENPLDGRMQTSTGVLTPPTSWGEPAAATQSVIEAVDALGSADDPTRSRVLVIDQLEQAFSTTEAVSSISGPSPGAAFLDAITDVRDRDPDLHIVMTVRADFYGQLMGSAVWSFAEPCMVPVTPLAGLDLLRAIREPAASLNVVIADPVVFTLASETEGQPGLLPFLQEALRRLWGRQPWWYLALPESELADGEFSVTSAIRRQAEHARDEIRAEYGEENGDRIVRSILLRLVNFVQGGRYTRQQIETSALVDESPDPAAYAGVLAILANEEQRIVTLGDRVMTVDGVSTHVDTVELSHEAIIEGWPEFHDWIDRHHGVEIERQTWMARLGGEFLTGRDLDAAERWRESADEIDFGVEPALSAYIVESRASQDAADEEFRQREAAKRKRLRVFVSALSVAFVVVVVALVFAVRASDDARRAQGAAERETDQRVATQLQTSAASYTGGLVLQALLVRAADLIDDTNRAVVEMLVTAERDPGIERRIDATTRNVGFEAAATLADGSVMIGDGVGGVSLWPADGREPTAAIDVGHGVLAMAAQPGTPWVAVGGGNSTPTAAGFDGSLGWIDLIDSSDPDLRSRRIHLDTDSPVAAVLFVDDQLVAGTWDGLIAVVDVSDPLNPAVQRSFAVPELPADVQCDIEAGDRKVRTLAADEGGRWLLAGTNHCLLVRWDRQSFELVDATAVHTSKVRSIAFVPGTDELLTTGDDATIRSWQLDDGAAIATTLVDAASEDAVGLEGRVITMCVSPDGNGVVTAGRDHLVRRWTRRGGQLSAPIELASHTSTVRQVGCVSDTRISSVAGDGYVLWNLERPNRWAERIADVADGSGAAVAVDPSGSGVIAVASASGLELIGLDGSAQQLVPSEHTDGFVDVAFGQQGAVVGAIGVGASGWPDEILVYDAATGDQLVSYPSVDAGQFTALSMLDESNLVAGMNIGQLLVVSDGRASVVELPTGRRAPSVALTPTGWVLVGDEGGTLLCGSVSRPGAFQSVELGRRINDIAVSPDVGTVAVGTADGAINAYPRVLPDAAADVCEPERWGGAAPPIVHDSIESVDITASGEILVAVTSAGDVEIWDIPRLRLVGRSALQVEDPAVSVSIAPDAAVIAVGAESSALRFDLDRPGLRDRLCELAGRNLTDDEAAAFLPSARHREIALCFG